MFRNRSARSWTRWLRKSGRAARAFLTVWPLAPSADAGKRQKCPTQRGGTGRADLLFARRCPRASKQPALDLNLTRASSGSTKRTRESIALVSCRSGKQRETIGQTGGQNNTSAKRASEQCKRAKCVPLSRPGQQLILFDAVELGARANWKVLDLWAASGRQFNSLAGRPGGKTTLMEQQQQQRTIETNGVRHN